MTISDPIDNHVGNRLRIRRLQIGMSLTELGDHIGVTHQQIQKYENAQNRIGASRLFELSRALGVPIEYFFEDLSSSDTPSNSGMADLESSGFLHEVLSTPDALNLNQAFIEIKDNGVRRAVINLVHALGG